MLDTIALQRALAAAGFDPGLIDGVPGRKTIAALKKFQAAKHLLVDGIAGPKALAVLFPAESMAAETRSPLVPWFDLALQKKGLHERTNKKTLFAFLKSDGSSIGDPTAYPWCGDFVETCIAVTLPEEATPANPYLARNWSTFGQACRPTRGAVLSFWRGSKSGINGHVGFYAGEDAVAFSVLGGNQANSVSIARVAKNRLLACRWPKTVVLPTTGATAIAGSGKLSVNEA